MTTSNIDIFNEQTITLFDRGYPSAHMFNFFYNRKGLFLMRCKSDPLKVIRETPMGDTIVDFNGGLQANRKIRVIKFMLSSETQERKPGAQPGHKGHKKKPLTPTKTTEISVQEEISKNPDYYPTGKTIVKQMVDIEICLNVTQYVTPEYRSRSTGTRIHAPFLEGIVNDVNYGGNIKAFAFFLNNYGNVSIDKTQAR